MGNAMNCNHVENCNHVDILVGDITAYEGDYAMNSSRRENEKVYLNVYHLNDEWAKSNHYSKQVLGIGGAFHAGIEVHGVEWTYGWESGVACAPPRSNTAHVYNETVYLGETNMSAVEVYRIIERMQQEWSPEDYELLEQNCCHFSDALCLELVGKHIPGWVTRFPHIAARAAAHLDTVFDVKRFVQRPDDADESPASPVHYRQGR